MATDVFGVQVTPADCRLRSLTVKIDLADYAVATDWDIREVIAAILSQERSKGFRLHVNVLGCWYEKFSFGLLSHLGHQPKMASVMLVTLGVTAKVQLTLASLPNRKPPVCAVEDVGSFLGANGDEWGVFLEEKLGKSP
ncbi:hypothetical protein BU23DRAFT_567975 [Bimuria novae-zelandiae CBS 107.79]|uniref:Uncharacterized protein n=1 Tax=Bimuria novae-zelandiae CBS 107.79 TaxID=1447943 RepID=A0A6A5V9L4_9PLEO|nr:hypothetical protein BU23DRAFT_567975 [Bimuria novae-zelandiae CBS 107.79]